MSRSRQRQPRHRRRSTDIDWPAASIVDLGGVDSARRPEHYVILFMGLFRALGTPAFNISKEAMLDALVDDKIDSLVLLADEASMTDDASVAIRGFLLGLMKRRATDRRLDAIFTAPSRSARFSRGLGRQFVPTVNRLVARAIDAVEPRPDFTRQEVCLLGFMVGKVANITRRTDPELWRRYASLLVDRTRPSSGTKPLSPVPLAFTDSATARGRAN